MSRKWTDFVKGWIQSKKSLLQQKLSGEHLTKLGGMVHALSFKLTETFPSSTPKSSSESINPSIRPMPVNSQSREPDFRLSEYFDGNSCHFCGFILQCELAFSRSPSLFPLSAAKITYLVFALKGSALYWANAYLHSHPLPFSTVFPGFPTYFWPVAPTGEISEAITITQTRKTQDCGGTRYRLLGHC